MDLIGPLGDLAIIGFGDMDEVIGDDCDDLYKRHIADVLSSATTDLRNE